MPLTNVSRGTVGFLQLEVDMSTLEYQKVVGGTVISVVHTELQGFKWTLYVEINRDEVVLKLGLPLWNESPLWSIDVKGTLRLLNQTPADAIHHDFSAKFTSNEWQEKHRIERAKISEQSGFLLNNAIKAEVEFTVVDMKGFRKTPSIDFTDHSDPCFDVCLVVEGSKLYAGKQVLAMQSPVFRTMLFGEFEESEKKEIELKDVKKEEFVELLGMMYLLSDHFTDKNVEYLLKLANQFDVKSVLEMGETYVMQSSKMEVFVRFKISDDYRLPMLQDHCLKSWKTVEEIAALEEHDAFYELSSEARAALLSRVITICKN